MEHECVIGLLYKGGDSELATLSELKEHVLDRVADNQTLRNLNIKNNWLYRQEWTLKDYADKRKSTNLTRFEYCPICGKKIDWKAIRREVVDGGDHSAS